MNISRVFVYSSLLFVALSLSACGGGGAGGDGRAAAIQAAIDADPTYISVPSGKSCHAEAYWKANLPNRLKGLKYVTVVPSGVSEGIFGGEPCLTVTWAKSLHVTPEITGEEEKLPVGHFIVDKVGEEQDGPGGKVTRYKAHFEWFPQGKDMLALHLAQEPAPRTDAIAVMHKDADGKWVAQLQF